MDTVLITNLDISIRIRIPDSKRVTESPLLPGMVLMAGLNSAQEARPWLEITGNVEVLQSVRMRMVLGCIQSWSSELYSFLGVDLG